ncbi:MAG: hypothetical protein AB1798_01075 [Spirochaetota bacterium]
MSTVFIYAGIDEAGYGPMFGPLIIARTVFSVERVEPGKQPPSLWQLLEPAVCRRISEDKNRIAVNDSKIIYTPGKGLFHLERGVLAFLSFADFPFLDFSEKRGINRIPELDNLLAYLALDEDSAAGNLAWYHDPAANKPADAPEVPFTVPLSELLKAREKLQGAALHAGVRLKDVKTAVVFEDRFNRLVTAADSKAACAWYFISRHISEIWESAAPYDSYVAVDRQGGRKNYSDYLSKLFPGADVKTLDETAGSSLYRIEKDGRGLTLSFMVRSEQEHLPTALASMAAKYIRELLMVRFQNFWKFYAPQVKPTAGYIRDGRRFLNQIEPVIAKLKIDRNSLIRTR